MDNFIEIRHEKPEEITVETSLLHIDADDAYSLFFEKCLLQNRPCLIKNVTKSWPCERSWVTSDGAPCMPLASLDSQIPVCVAQCDTKEFNAQKTVSTTLGEYEKYWIDRRKEIRYLKDCHFTRFVPADSVYRVPKFFASDWLGEFYDAHPHLQDDYRFLYLGPKGSWTPLHRDVFSSFSWSANVTGRKRWLLIKPGCESHFRDQLGNLPFQENLAVPPDMIEDQRTLFIEQEAGDAIFVPSGWYHQVWNLEDTLSINHNWINANNIENMWKTMKTNLHEVKEQLRDLNDVEGWEEQCQVLLRAHCGLDYYQFNSFLTYLITIRISQLTANKPLNVFGGWEIGPEYMKYDLASLAKILNEFFRDRDAEKLKFDADEPPSDVQHKLLKFLDT